ncbi:AzlD domain-containing protein [Rhodoferax sp.]|uniref:AzlD domain-containing protein n=1 Tax=Rhodoferax sp. TaxID=50421 RepID=UPI00374D2FE9
MSGNTDLYTVALIIGLALITVLTRCFFFLSRKSAGLPHWAQRGLQYAPIAALSAVVLPEVLMTQGQLLTIVAGMLVYLPLHLGLGW